MSSSKQRRTQLTTPMMKIIPIMMKEATRIRINRRSSSSLKRQIIQLAEPFTILIRPKQKQNEEQESFETYLGNIFLRLGNLEWKHLFTKISQLLRRLNTSTELWHISKLSDIKTNHGFDQISCANNTVHRLHQTLSLPDINIWVFLHGGTSWKSFFAHWHRALHWFCKAQLLIWRCPDPPGLLWCYQHIFQTKCQKPLFHWYSPGSNLRVWRWWIRIKRDGKSEKR